MSTAVTKMGELFANNSLGKGVRTLLQNPSFFCHFSSVYRHFLQFPDDSLFSNRLILPFHKLGQLTAPQCLMLAATWIPCANLIALRTGFKSSRSMLRRVVRAKYRDLIHRWKEEHHIIMTEKELISYIYFPSLCCAWQKKKKKRCIQLTTLEILLLTISEFVFNQQTLLSEVSFGHPVVLTVYVSFCSWPNTFLLHCLQEDHLRRAGQSVPTPCSPQTKH